MKEAQREGCSVTESELADHHYKLGRILWTMGGNLRDDPNQARAHFEAASKEECDSQVRRQNLQERVQGPPKIIEKLRMIRKSLVLVSAQL